MKRACKKLNEMLKDEKEAPKNYSKLKKLLPASERKKISKIQKQERQHYKTLKDIKKKLMKK